MKYKPSFANCYFRILVLGVVASIVMITVGCSASGEQLFTAVFEKSAAVVRAWGESCIANNLSKADEYLLPDQGGDFRPPICNQLATHPSRAKFSVLSIEDHGSLIGSRILVMRIKNQATGKSVPFNVTLANTDRGGVKIMIAEYQASYGAWSEYLK